MAIMMGQLQQLLVKQVGTDKEVVNTRKKDVDHTFAKTWEETAVPETQDPIGRVVAKLEKPKQEDAQRLYMGLFKAEVIAGRATLDTYVKLSKTEESCKSKRF